MSSFPTTSRKAVGSSSTITSFLVGGLGHHDPLAMPSLRWSSLRSAYGDSSRSMPSSTENRSTERPAALKASPLWPGR